MCPDAHAPWTRRHHLPCPTSKGPDHLGREAPHAGSPHGAHAGPTSKGPDHLGRGGTGTTLRAPNNQKNLQMGRPIRPECCSRSAGLTTTSTRFNRARPLGPGCTSSSEPSPPWTSRCKGAWPFGPDAPDRGCPQSPRGKSSKAPGHWVRDAHVQCAGDPLGVFASKGPDHLGREEMSANKAKTRRHTSIGPGSLGRDAHDAWEALLHRHGAVSKGPDHPGRGAGRGMFTTVRVVCKLQRGPTAWAGMDAHPRLLLEGRQGPAP